MAIFDPDTMSTDDLDHNDKEMVQSWFNHPNTLAMRQDTARAFNRLPLLEQEAIVLGLMMTYDAEMTAIQADTTLDPAVRERKLSSVQAVIEVFEEKLRLIYEQQDQADSQA